MLTSVYLYQLEYFCKKRLLPQLTPKLTKLKSNFFKKPTQSNDLQTTDNSQEAMNLAKNAAQLTRTATTKAEWYQVGIEWEKIIKMMKTVTKSNPN